MLGRLHMQVGRKEESKTNMSARRYILFVSTLLSLASITTKVC